MIFHLVEAEVWADRRAAGDGDAPISGPGPEGFVHCCDEHQIAGVAERFFPAAARLVALGVDPTRLVAETRYEQGADRPGERFAHVYGAIPVGAVIEVRPVA